MTPSEKYGQCTVDGCKRILSELNELNDNVTVGELRKFLTKRQEIALKLTKTTAESLIELIKGKCLRIEFAPDHVELLNIVDIKPFESFGSIDATLIGETIVKYKGEIRYENAINSKYSSHFPNSSTEEISIEKFNLLKMTINGLNI